jgi:hypothetical protein
LASWNSIYLAKKHKTTLNSFNIDFLLPFSSTKVWSTKGFMWDLTSSYHFTISQLKKTMQLKWRHRSLHCYHPHLNEKDIILLLLRTLNTIS